MRRLGAGPSLFWFFSSPSWSRDRRNRTKPRRPLRRGQPGPTAISRSSCAASCFPTRTCSSTCSRTIRARRKNPTPPSSGGASAAYANVYSGWQVVEGAAVALEESADLILKGGRLCSNGKPAPVARADYVKFAAALRDTSRQALVAAKAKDQMKLSDITNDLADACSMCHEKYRDKGPAGSPERCLP